MHILTRDNLYCVFIYYASHSFSLLVFCCSCVGHRRIFLFVMSLFSLSDLPTVLMDMPILACFFAGKCSVLPLPHQKFLATPLLLRAMYKRAEWKKAIAKLRGPAPKPSDPRSGINNVK